jgi:hypothetical protein
MGNNDVEREEDELAAGINSSASAMGTGIEVR